MKSNHKYFMFHKPAGYITAKKDERHPVVMEFFTQCEDKTLHPVGRLDKDTEGLLFITNDGTWNHAVMHPKHHIEKTYYFIAFGFLDKRKIEKLGEGVMIQGTKARPGKVSNIQSKTLREIMHLLDGAQHNKTKKNLLNTQVVIGEITITEGKKHQVKHMLKEVGCKVLYLKRLSIGTICLDETLQVGEYRNLTDAEINCFIKGD
ncbi:MAG: pseudouridine synthase [Lachnospiraceae bacterium]